MEKKEQKSVISEGTVISGNIKTSDDIAVFGEVNGNIKCDKNVEINGHTNGDINAENLTIASGSIKGKIELKNKIDIQYADKIEGDIITKQIGIKSCASLIANIKTITE